MKKKLFLGAVAVLIAVAVKAASVVYSTNAVNESALAYSKTYSLDLNALNIANLSFQAIYSSATVAAVPFTDGTVSTGQVTVTSTTSLVATAATDQVTVTATSNLVAKKATDFLTVTSTVNLTGATITFNGRKFINGIHWLTADTSSGTAANIAAALTIQPDIDAIASGTIVYATATVGGITGNTFTLASSTPSITVNSANFTGGQDDALANAYLTINGRIFRQGYDWFEKPTSSETATSIASMMNNITGMSAAASGSVVYATATTAGSAANAFTVSASTSALTVLSAAFTGGLDSASITIGGVTLLQGRDWTAVSTASGCAKAISDAIMANSTLSAISSTWTAAGIVYATSTATGSVNYTLVSSIPGSLSVSGATMTGGTSSAVNLTTSKITKASHGLTLGLPVLLTKSAGTTPAPLAANTTYYAVPVDANTFQLATTSTGAVAGSVITITTQTATGGGSFTLTPLTITGTPGFKWQWSNDNANWTDMAVSSVTFASPYTAATTIWDMQRVNVRYVRLNVTGPTTGGLKLQVVVNGKDQ